MKKKTRVVENEGLRRQVRMDKWAESMERVILRTESALIPRRR